MEEKKTKDRRNKKWEDNIKEWTGIDFGSPTWAAEDRTKWKAIVVNHL